MSDHLCSGPTVREEETDRYHFSFSKCTTCDIEWCSGILNLDALRRINLQTHDEQGQT